MLRGLKSIKIKTLTYFAVAALLLVSFAEAGLAFVNLAQADQARRAWQESYQTSVRESHILVTLRHELGYGGFIHDFKNYVLRQNSELLIESRRHLARSDELLTELSALGSLPGRSASTRNIRIALENYRGVLDMAEEMVKRGMSSQVVDAAVRVDDDAALNALAEFDDQLEENRSRAAMSVGSILSSHASYTASVNISATIMLTMLCFLVIAVLHNRILAPLERLREVMAGIVQGDFSVPVADTGREDEVGEMARALQIFRDDAEELEDLRVQHFEAEKNSIIEEARTLVEMSRQLVAEERKQREQLASEIGKKAAELKRSEALANGVLDTVSDAFVSADRSGLILGFNRAAEDMFGYQVADVVGKKINLLMSEDVAVAHDEYLANHSAQSSPVTMGPNREVLARRKDGTEFPVLITVMTLADGTGDTLVATIRDITDEHRKIEKIQRLGRLVDRSQNAVFTLNADTYAIQEANGRAEEILGYSIDDFLNLSYFDLIEGPSPDDIREFVKPMLEGDIDEIIVEARHRRMDGSSYPVEARVHYSREEGSPVFLVVAQDITERLKAHEELTKAKEAAETASRAKSTFLANMSHELRTPLNAVIGYSELLLEDIEDNGHEQYRPDIETVSAAGEHLLTLINEVLDLSKIEAGKADLWVSEVDVYGVMHDICKLVRPQAAANCNTVTLEVDPDVDIMWSDETRIRQIIVNLLSNATKFTQDGTIILSASRAEISGDEHIIFKVTDTGIGIPEDQIDRIFDEFSQVGGGDADKPEGTGLGLAICTQLVQLMGGDIRVSSVVQQGTEVTFRLPVDARIGSAGEVLDAAEDVEKVSTANGFDGPQRLRVLVIEDNESLRDLMEQFLERENYEVATAPGGVKGLEMIEEFRPQTVLLDISLPDLDGREVYRSIRAQYTKEQVKVIFCTGRDGLPVNEIFAENQYLTKPVGRDELLLALQNCA